MAARLSANSSTSASRWMPKVWTLAPAFRCYGANHAGTHATPRISPRAYIQISPPTYFTPSIPTLPPFHVTPQDACLSLLPVPTTARTTVFPTINSSTVGGGFLSGWLVRDTLGRNSHTVLGSGVRPGTRFRRHMLLYWSSDACQLRLSNPSYCLFPSPTAGQEISHSGDER